MTHRLCQLYTLSQPWGVLSEKQIYQLVATEDARPDRPDPTRDARVGLNNYFWDIIEECWHKEPRMRPSFDIVVRLWRSHGTDTQVSAFNAKTMPAASRGKVSFLEDAAERFRSSDGVFDRRIWPIICSVDQLRPKFHCSFDALVQIWSTSLRETSDSVTNFAFIAFVELFTFIFPDIFRDRIK